MTLPPGAGAQVMKFPVLGADELRALVSFEDLIAPMIQAFQQSSRGKADNGLLVLFPQRDRTAGDVYVKTGILEGAPYYVVKISPWFAANVRSGQPQGGFVALFDSSSGHTVALLEDQHYLSDIRTAAAGAVAARIFAPADTRTAGVLGAGVQAYWQSLALYRERKFKTLSIWARNAHKAETLAETLRAALPAVDVDVNTNLARVVHDSDVLITATQSRDPLVRGEWLRSGQHITAIGADDPTKCELDPQALHRSKVFVDSFDAAAANGDVCRAIENGGYALTDLAGEIGQVLTGSVAGRSAPEDITIAKLVGIGAQDVVAATIAVDRAKRAAANTDSEQANDQTL
jgi:ornithine cyclodeaminase/alanine dehydrogenase-like protein (mu-crystallin family)